MPLYPAAEREKFYQLFYNGQTSAEAIPSHASQPPKESPYKAMAERGYARLREYLDTLNRDPRFQQLQPESLLQQLLYIEAHYGKQKPPGIGVKQGEYAALTPAQAKTDAPFIATDYLIECNGLVLTARDAQGRVLKTAMAHVDVMTNPKPAVAQLLKEMPQGAQIDATLITSNVNGNPYLQMDLLQQLMATPAIRQVRFYPQSGSTAAVEVASGKIFNYPSQETPKTAYQITELPLTVRFSPYDHNKLSSVRLAFSSFLADHQPIASLNKAYEPGRGFTNRADLQASLNTVLRDGNVTADELHQLASTIRDRLQHGVTIDYVAQPNGNTRFTVKTVEQNEMYAFESKAAPELGRKGSVRG